jgi:hypothetical protein
VLALHAHLTLRSVAKRSISKGGNAKNGVGMIMRGAGIVPVAAKGGGYPTRIETLPLRSVPQGEAGVQPSAEEYVRRMPA